MMAKFTWTFLFTLLMCLILSTNVYAQDLAGSAVALADEFKNVPISSTVRLLAIVTALTFVPAMVLAMTPFTRFIIVFGMLRQAVGLQQSPPNQVLIGIAVFLSMLIMEPTLNEVYTVAVEPFMNGELQVLEAFELGMEPMRMFLLSNTRKEDLNVMINIAHVPTPENLSDIPNSVVISSFILSELKTAFIIGVKVYLPFLIIDVVIANILLGMGMMVLPPVIISLPFKLLLFVLMDGWTLLIRLMSASFYGV
jgi:flagellar biosynthesis protein FliP